MPRAARLQLSAHHEQELEDALIAKVALRIHMGKRATFHTMAMAMATANTSAGGRDGALDAFMRATKRIEYDHKTRVLSVTMASRFTAPAWNDANFKMQQGWLHFVVDDDNIRGGGRDICQQTAVNV